MSDAALRAEHLAAKAHAAQRDKGGKPYIGHLERVAQAAEQRALRALADGLDIEPDEVAQAGWLHDIIEDTPITATDLRAQGFSERVVEMVEILTRPQQAMAYPARIQQIIATGNLGAILIKLSDVEDNASPFRVVPGQPQHANRYVAEIPQLKQAAAVLGYTGS